MPEAFRIIVISAISAAFLLYVAYVALGGPD